MKLLTVWFSLLLFLPSFLSSQIFSAPCSQTHTNCKFILADFKGIFVEFLLLHSNSTIHILFAFTVIVTEEHLYFSKFPLQLQALHLSKEFCKVVPVLY
jgi:hypothetical protein